MRKIKNKTKWSQQDLQIKLLGRQCRRKGNGDLIRGVSNLKKQKKQKEGSITPQRRRYFGQSTIKDAMQCNL